MSTEFAAALLHAAVLCRLSRVLTPPRTVRYHAPAIHAAMEAIVVKAVARELHASCRSASTPSSSLRPARSCSCCGAPPSAACCSRPIRRSRACTCCWRGRGAALADCVLPPAPQTPGGPDIGAHRLPGVERVVLFAFAAPRAGRRTCC